jgi:hypothetical protein
MYFAVRPHFYISNNLMVLDYVLFEKCSLNVARYVWFRALCKSMNIISFLKHTKVMSVLLVVALCGFYVDVDVSEKLAACIFRLKCRGSDAEGLCRV